MAEPQKSPEEKPTAASPAPAPAKPASKAAAKKTVPVKPNALKEAKAKKAQENPAPQKGKSGIGKRGKDAKPVSSERKEGQEYTSKELRGIADSKTWEQGIKLSEGMTTFLKGVPGGRTVLKFLRWGPGGSLVMIAAGLLDLLSAPFANMPGQEINWKKSLINGFIMLTVSVFLLSVYFYLIGNPNVMGMFTKNVKIIGGVMGIVTAIGSLSLIASSYRIKTHRRFSDLFSKKIDHSPAFDNGFAIELGEVRLSLEDCHTNIGALGGIGSGKTQAVMNPLLDQFFRQLSLPEPTDAQKLQPEFAWWHKNPLQKCGALILDQKGDFIDFVIYTMLRYKRPLEDLVVIDPTLDLYCFNPLDPIASADDNANMLSQVQKVVSGGGGGKDKFWDEASKDTVRDFLQMLEVIKPKDKIGLDDLARYIREDELSAYLCDRVDEVVNAKYASGKLNYEEKSKYLDTSSRARAQWVNNKSDNVKSTLKVTINQLLGDFAADPRLQKVFCRNTNFDFKDVFNKGKVVLFRGTGVSEKTARVICVTLKLAFQTWAKRRNGANAEKYGVNNRRTCLFFVDEFQEFVTPDDGRFFGVSRSSKVAGVIATQAYSSLQFAMGDEIATNLLRQNIGTWIFLRTTDPKTLELGETLGGMMEKEKLSKNIQTDSLLDNAMSMSSGGQASQSGSMGVSKQFEAYVRKDEFLKLATVDGNKSATGPYYSESIIYHYHDTDTKRVSRMYRTRLKHIYDIDKTFNAANKSGKVSQNTMDLDQLMFDRNATIRTLRRVIPHIQEVWKNQTIEKEILEAEIAARRDRNRKVESTAQNAKKLENLRDELINRVIQDYQNSTVASPRMQMEPLTRTDLEKTSSEDLGKEIEELNSLYLEALNDKEISTWERDSLKAVLEDLRLEQQLRDAENAEKQAMAMAQAIIRFGPLQESN